MVRWASANLVLFSTFFAFFDRFLPVFVPFFALFPSMSCAYLYVHNFPRTHVSGIRGRGNRGRRANLAFDKETAEATRNALSRRDLNAKPCFNRRDRRERRNWGEPGFVPVPIPAPTPKGRRGERAGTQGRLRGSGQAAGWGGRKCQCPRKPGKLDLPLDESVFVVNRTLWQRKSWKLPNIPLAFHARREYTTLGQSYLGEPPINC